MSNHFCKIFLYSSIIFVLGVFTSCSTQKKTIKKPLKEYGVNHLIREVEKNDFDFDMLQAKMSIKVEKDGSDINLKGQMRMDKDSVIWASLSIGLGLELARVMVRPDSIFYINRTDKTAMIENMNILEKLLPEISSFDFIQSIFIGNDTQIKNGDDFKASVDGDSYKLTISKKLKRNIKQQDSTLKIIVKDVWINPELFRITKYNIKEFNDTKRRIQLEYLNFIMAGEKYIPSRIICTIQGEEDIKITIDYSNILIDNKLEFPFNIPNKYKRVKTW